MNKRTRVLQCLLLIFVVLFANLIFSHHTYAAAGINQQLAFEGKIVLTNGTNIPTGTYNMEFKIYTGGTGTGGGTLQWTEDYLVGGSGGITITNGTFEVNLGSVNPFGSQVNWNSDTLYLSLQVGNTASCTLSGSFQSSCGGDGEMNPYIRLTAVPYAFNSLELGGVAASGYAQLANTQTWSGINTFSATGSNAVALSGAPAGSTTSSLLQLGSPIAGGNANGTYIGLNAPSASTADLINLQNNGASKLQVDYLGDLTSAATLKGAAVTATGVLSGNSLSVGAGAFAVNAAGAVTASTGIASTGYVSVTTGTYTPNLVLINDGQTTAPPTIPSGYLPALTVINSETSGSRPLFFGYTAGGAYASYLNAGACGSFSTLCIDLGNGSTSYTGLENTGTNLNLGGGDDGNFTTLSDLVSGNTQIGAGGDAYKLTVNGSLGVTGLTTYSGGVANSYSSSTAGSGEAFSATNTNSTTTATTVNAQTLSLAGTANGTNTINGLNFANVTAVAGNTFNGLSFGTGYTNLINSANFIVAATGNITNAGTYNGNTFNGTGLTFAGSGATVTTAAGELVLGSATNVVGLSASTTSLQKIAAGLTNFDFDDPGTTTLQLENSGSGVANLNLYGGSLETGSTPVIRLTNAGVLTNITGATVAGTSTFENTGDTQTLLEVDGTNNYVQVGSETADASATQLVLDSKNTTGDPTAIAGGMYYNSNTGNFRCSESGAWENCIGGLLSSNTAASTAVNTCTTACAAFSNISSIPANYCTPGRVIHIVASGVFSMNTNNAFGAWGVYLGTNATTKTSDTLIGGATPTSATTTAAVTNGQFQVDFYLVCDTSTTVNGQGDFSFNTAAATATTSESTLGMESSTTNTVTLSSAQNIYLFPAFGTSAAANTVTDEQFIVTGE